MKNENPKFDIAIRRKCNMLKIPKQRKCLIWGTGFEGLRFRYTICDEVNIVGFVDNYANESSFKGDVIYRPENVMGDEYYYFIATSESVYLEIKKQLINEGKQEFKDFAYYKWYLNKLIYLHGNCHMKILQQMLLSVEEFEKNYSIYPLTLIFESNGEIDENVLRNIDIFIHQDIRIENAFGYKQCDEYVRKYLDEKCLDITVPNVLGYGKAFFPQDKWNQRNKILNKDRNGMFPYGDIFIDNCIQKSMTTEEIVLEILEGNPFSKQEIEDNFNLYMGKLLERQKNWDFEIYDFIMENYKEHQLFYNQGHPTNIIMKEIAKKTLRKLGIEGEPYCEEIMDMYEEFVYPCVANVLSLKWSQKEIRKSKIARKIAMKMDMEEYVREYVWWCY